MIPAAMALPFSGLDGVDLGTPTQGKYATFLLAEMDAAALRVERPSAAAACGYSAFTSRDDPGDPR
jgi:hypothetical protein